MRGVHGWIAAAGLIADLPDPHLFAVNQRPWGRVMKNRNRSILGSIFSALTGAVAAAAAVRHSRRPADDDLRALGIDPAEFAKIRRYY